MSESRLSFEDVEALGVSHEAYDEVLSIMGRVPTLDEFSTLLAMWESNGRQQSLYGWLKGQHHATVRDEYLYDGAADHRAIREPRIRECIEIARTVCRGAVPQAGEVSPGSGWLLYMVGNVSTEFADSEYARRCLHLINDARATEGHAEDCDYITMILGAMHDAGRIRTVGQMGAGGLFVSLLRLTAPAGYDILVPREVRLDAFLFGEEAGRYLAIVGEERDDEFLLKMDEARLNCCFLGRTTKNRIMVDGFDFGPVGRYAGQ